MKKDYYLVLQIPSENKEDDYFDNGKAFDYPKWLPLPQVDHVIQWDDKGKIYYVKVIKIKHSVGKNFNEITIYTEHIK